MNMPFSTLPDKAFPIAPELTASGELWEEAEPKQTENHCKKGKHQGKSLKSTEWQCEWVTLT